MADEAFSSFLAVLESVPKWIADLESLLATLKSGQDETVPESQPADASAPRKPSRRSSRRSRCSQHVKPEAEKAVTPGTTQPTLVPPQLLHLATSDALGLSQRKRKSASVCSGDRSGPSKYRTKRTAVIYYDGDVQKRFEMLVRAIGTCRNAIRKGKMGAKVDYLSNLSRTGSSSSEASCSSSHGKDVTPDIGKSDCRSVKPKQSDCGMFGKRGDTKVFDAVDSLLEKGQSEIERSAHQLLRDGDCTPELTHANKYFAEVQTLVEKEVPVLRRRAEKAAERQRKSAEEAAAQERHLDVLDTQDIVAAFEPCDGALEVDSSGSDDEEPDFGIVNKLPTMGRYQMRSSRLLASA